MRNAILAEVLEIMLPKDEEIKIALVDNHSRVLWFCEYFRPHAIEPPKQVQRLQFSQGEAKLAVGKE